MLIVTYCKGLPGSGKSTWAKNQVNLFPDKIKIINMDLLRQMFDNYIFNSSHEKFIKKAKFALLELCLIEGRNVIMDNTNLSKKAQNSLINKVREIAAKHQLRIEIVCQDFTHVPLEVCLERNAQRPPETKVKEKDIINMYNWFINTEHEDFRKL